MSSEADRKPYGQVWWFAAAPPNQDRQLIRNQQVSGSSPLVGSTVNFLESDVYTFFMRIRNERPL